MTATTGGATLLKKKIINTYSGYTIRCERDNRSAVRSTDKGHKKTSGEVRFLGVSLTNDARNKMYIVKRRLCIGGGVNGE